MTKAETLAKVIQRIGPNDLNGINNQSLSLFAQAGQAVDTLFLAPLTQSISKIDAVRLSELLERPDDVVLARRVLEQVLIPAANAAEKRVADQAGRLIAIYRDGRLPPDVLPEYLESVGKHLIAYSPYLSAEAKKDLQEIWDALEPERTRIAVAKRKQLAARIEAIAGQFDDGTSADARLLRREITESGLKYADARNPISKLRGTESELIDASLGAKGHVISFGSGPDIFRPLVDFPLASHFHLVDLLIGWGTGPGEVIHEFKERIKAINSTADISVIHPGFTARMSPKDLIAHPSDPKVIRDQTPHFWLGFRTRDAYREPLVIGARWKDSSGRQQQRMFYLHPLDYNDEGHMAELGAFLLPAQKLAGMLVTGTMMPRSAAVNSFLDKMARDEGTFVLETWSGTIWEAVVAGLKERFTLTRMPAYDEVAVTYLARKKG